MAQTLSASSPLHLFFPIYNILYICFILLLETLWKLTELFCPWLFPDPNINPAAKFCYLTYHNYGICYWKISICVVSPLQNKRVLSDTTIETKKTNWLINKSVKSYPSVCVYDTLALNNVDDEKEGSWDHKTTPWESRACYAVKTEKSSLDMLHHQNLTPTVTIAARTGCRWANNRQRYNACLPSIF